MSHKVKIIYLDDVDPTGLTDLDLLQYHSATQKFSRLSYSGLLAALGSSLSPADPSFQWLVVEPLGPSYSDTDPAQVWMGVDA